jgi:hypothetical protein
MKSDQSTVPCKTCGSPVEPYRAQKDTCDSCWEVESRLDTFLQNPRALHLIAKKLKEIQLNAAQAIEMFDEDEDEEYSAKLDKAREAVISGLVRDILVVRMGEDELEGLRRFAVNKFKLTEMTLSEIKDRFSTYLEEECQHGEPLGDCTACDVAGDLAYDAAREDRP